jgi:hypothetical protein
MTCERYSDTWKPFVELFRKFWPDCPYPVTMLTDHFIPNMGYDGDVIESGKSWVGMLADFAMQSLSPVLMLQDDFFLSAPVRDDLIEYGLHQMEKHQAGIVRLYPCPGATDYIGDKFFGEVKRGTRYRVSCQLSIFHPAYLAKLAEHANTPQEFEIKGSPASDTFPEPVLAWRREVTPFPVSYICTAVVGAKWHPSAKELCDKHGIEADWSRRGFIDPS